MINVNQITAQLARMPDQALQQFAAMHKNDPYTVSLALSESNRRKQMRTAAQGQQGMGEPPKVVDQEVAQMAAPQMAQAMPEDTGIGALPAGDMNFADGGIVGYADGGLNFNERAARQLEEKGSIYSPFFGLPADERRRLEAAAADPESLRTTDRAAMANTIKKLAAAGYDVATLIPRGIMGAADTAVQGVTQSRIGRALGLDAVPALPESAFGGNRASMTPMMDRLQAEATPALPVSSVYPSETMRGAATMPPPAMAAADVEQGRGAGAPPPPAPGAAPTAGLGAIPRAAAPERDFLSQQQAVEKRLGPAVDEFRADREAITEEAVKGRREGLAALKADQEAELAAMGKGQEERLSKREAELGKSKDTNTGMAFLEAGLAMMQSKGRGLAGIAEGAQVGTKQYASGLKDIRAAQEKLDAARDRMEELRQNKESLNKSEIRAEERGIRDLVVQGKKDLLTGVEKASDKQTALSLAATASDIATQGRQAQTASAERIAGIQASRAVMADERADARARLTAAGELAKNAQITIKDMNASDAERQAAQKDLAAANTVLRGLGGTADVSSQAKADVAKYLNPAKPPR